MRRLDPSCAGEPPHPGAANGPSGAVGASGAGSGLTIRRAGPADVAAIRTLTRAAYAPWVPLIGREPRPMTADYDRAVRAHRIDMLLDSAAVVALIELIDEGETLLVENLAVAPGSQGRGLGEALLRHAEAVAAAGRHRILRLYTNARFTANLRFYGRRGFAVTREEPIADGTVVHMAKAVGPDAAAAR